MPTAPHGTYGSAPAGCILALLVHFLLWQAAKPSGDKCTPYKYPITLKKNKDSLAFRADDYDAMYEKHKSMGCICFENPAMGIYFISDPDGYWIEIVPEAK